MRILRTLFILSVFLAPRAVSAQCVQSTPYTENFDGSSWVSPSGFSNSGSIPSCWNRTVASANFLWMASPPSFASTATGPSGDHTSGTGGYAFSDGWFTGVGASLQEVTNLITPPIDLSNDTLPRLEFYYHMYGSDITWLNIRVRKFGTNTWTNLTTFNSSTTNSQFTSGTSPWQKHVESLSQWAGDTIQIRFNAKRSVNFSWFTNSRVAIDDLTVEETPSCDQPFSVSASSVSATTASISWSSLNTSALGYEIQAAPVGTAIGSGTVFNVSTNPATISNLNANTDYQVRVREICAAGDTSIWSANGSFRTACAQYTVPFVEDFEGSGWEPSLVWNQQGDIDPCWITQGAAQKFWTVGPPPFAWTTTGPSGDHTTGSGQWAYHLKQSAFATGTDPRLISPWIDLDTLSSPELSFWYHGFGQNMGTLNVRIQTIGGTWASLWDTTGQTHSSQSAAWLEKIVDLSSYATDTVRIRFDYSAPQGNFNTQFAIDDIKIDRAPSCPKPSFTQVTGVGVQVVQLDWTSGGASNFQIRYREVGTSTWSWTTSNVSAKGIPGLSSQTQYEWEVRDSCGVGDVSSWVLGPRFQTNCNLYTAPFEENFSNTNIWVDPGFPDQNGDIDDCWLRSDSTDYFWTGGRSTTAHYAGTGPSGDHTSGTGGYTFARSGTPFSSNVDTELRTPVIDLDTLHSPELSFWYHMHGLDIDKLRIYVKPLGQPIVLLATITGQQQTTNTANWQKRTISLSNWENDTVQIVFKAYRGAGGGFSSFRADIALDDILIDEPTVCTTPNVTASNISYNSVDLDWTGKATSSAIEYDLSGFTLGTGNLIGASNKSATLSGLQAGTTYDAWVQDTCTPTLTSVWSLVTFTTLPCPTITTTGSVSGTGASITGEGTTADADSTVWFWGDGTNSIGDTSNHSYTSFGLFDVYQVVYNECGNVDSLLHNYAYCDITSLGFGTTVNGLNVDFDATASTGTGLTYYWTFGDGNSGTGDVVSNGYSAAGSYTVELIGVNACGDSTIISQTLTLCPAVNLAFTSSASGTTFTFNATPTNLLNYQWDFGDGNSGTGVTASNTYGSNGTFTVTLTAQDSCGNTFTFSDDVATCDQPTGDFTFNIVSTSTSGMLVNFQATAQNATEYHWYWGDGTNDKGNTPNAQHLYGVITLNYTVSLVMINDCGDSTTVTRSLNEIGITEEDLPFSIYPSPTSGNFSIEFLTSSQTAIRVTSMEGKEVLSDEFNAQMYQADLSALKAGTYMVHVERGGLWYYYPLVKI